MRDPAPGLKKVVHCKLCGQAGHYRRACRGTDEDRAAYAAEKARKRAEWEAGQAERWRIRNQRVAEGLKRYWAARPSPDPAREANRNAISEALHRFWNDPEFEDTRQRIAVEQRARITKLWADPEWREWNRKRISEGQKGRKNGVRRKPGQTGDGNVT